MAAVAPKIRTGQNYSLPLKEFMLYSSGMADINMSYIILTLKMKKTRQVDYADPSIFQPCVRICLETSL